MSSEAATITTMTILVLAVLSLGLAISLIHLRRRHRALRECLRRVAKERDDARSKARSPANAD